MSINHQSLRGTSIGGTSPRRGRIPATIAALGLSASLGLGLAPMASAQEVPETGGVVSDAQLTAALDVLGELTGGDVNEVITGLVTGNAEIAEFIDYLATDPTSLASVSVTSITAEGEPAGLILRLLDKDGATVVTEIDNVDPAVTGQFGELIAQLAEDLLNQEDTVTSETEAGEVGLADILEVLEALVAAVDARANGDAGTEVSDSGVSDAEAEVIAELQRRVDELIERVPELEQLTSQVEEIESRLSDLIDSVTGSGSDTDTDTDGADAGESPTGGDSQIGETTVDITFDEDGNPIATITTNDGETITQTRGEADASQVADVLGVLDVVTGAEAISQAREATADLIAAVQNPPQSDGDGEQAVTDAQARLVEILDNAITTEDEAEREAIAAQNARIAELVVLAADANTREDLILTVDEEVTTELVARTGEQLAMSLREAIAVEMYEAGIEDEAIAAVTGVSTDEGRLQVTVPIAGNQGGNGGGNDGVDDDTDGAGEGNDGAGDDTDGAGDDTDGADDELTRAELLEQLAEQLREMADQLRETSADIDAMTTEELEERLREVLEQMRGAEDDAALREIIEGLSLEELTALNEALKASGDGAGDGGSGGSDSGNNSDGGNKTGSDTDRDQATRDLIDQVLGEVDNLELTPADNRTPREGGTGSNSGGSGGSDTADNEAEEEIVVEIDDPNAGQTSQSDGRPADAPRDGNQPQPVADQGQYANQAQEELAVTGSDSSLIAWAIGGLAALAAALGGGAFWWKRRQEGEEA